MFLIRVSDDVVNKLVDISSSQQRSFSNYLTELLEQAIRADELKCSLKMIVDFYEFKTMQKEEIEMEGRTGETEELEEPSIENMFERTLAKLKPKITESEEYKMLSRLISEITS